MYSLMRWGYLSSSKARKRFHKGMTRDLPRFWVRKWRMPFSKSTASHWRQAISPRRWPPVYREVSIILRHSSLLLVRIS